MTPPTLPLDVYDALPPAVQAYIRYLEARLADLEARLDQNSSNSSKPPSSDGPQDAIDSDADAAGETPTFTYSPSQGWPDFDAGIVLDPTDPTFSYMFA